MTSYAVQLPGDLATLAKACGTTRERVAVAAFAALLYRYTGRNHVELALSRDRSDDTAVHLTVTGEATFRALVKDAGAAQEHPAGDHVRTGISFGAPVPADLPYEAQLVLPALDEGPLPVGLRYDETAFDTATAERLLDHFHTLLAEGLARPDLPLAELEFLGESELHRILVEWNATAAELPHPGSCLHEAFEARAARAPDAVVVAQDDQLLTFRQVNAAANRLAHHLRGLGVGPDRRVGLYLDQSPDLLVAILGVLKAGGAYVPLDPGYPSARVATMITGVSCVAVISRSDLADGLPRAEGPGGPHLIVLDRAADELAAEPDHDPRPVAGPDNLCYVMHTSGSTGTPKPIALCHRGVLNNIADLNTRFDVGPGDSVLGLSSPSFDMSVYEFLGVPIGGGTLVLPSPGRTRDPGHWAELSARHRVTLWNTAPALLELVLEHLDHAERPAPDDQPAHPRPADPRPTGRALPLRDLRLVMLAGDWIPLRLPDRTRSRAPECRFISLGGATEASIYSTVFEVETTDPAWTSIPYGRPMANQRVYILDDALRPVPPGVTGELYLAGTGLAREYLDQPERTAERFLPWSYGPVSERLYRTGDLARFDADGLIELIGRVDLQVKIHGLRVELTEIEAALRDHPAVKEAVVTAQTDAAGAPALVGYAVPHESADFRADDVREHLASRLPSHMVPGVLLTLPALPLSPNGKIDRKALPAAFAPGPAGPDPAAPAEDRPQGVWEARLGAAWQEVLGVASVRRDDDFFGLGGDSMKAMRTMALIPGFTLADLYRYPTLRELAGHLENTAGDPGVEPPGDRA
ncbi:non-ribosomal peptide synthetase [Streptomyces sp. NRRL S-920]|uniref:non-ribosomal peptide synthetase n=1 Tax=Streptomyces sp. NRRL S-920 TaxID=1463921 RepID=UPI00068A958A|nr:non-ribosomal peptide synthetase [Streptomyces sp. NRRL S-920]